MRSVLVVDEDDAFRAELVRELEDRGFDVRAAATIAHATALLSTHPPRVLVTDLCGDQANGIGLIEEAQRLSHQTRSILMSQEATARDYQAALNAGAVCVLCKPFDITEMVRAIEHALECETGFRGSLHGLSLLDLMQMFHMTRRSITLRVQAPQLSGSVTFVDGALRDARWGETQGTEALSALLASPGGTVSTAPTSEVEPTLSGSFDQAVLSALQVVDERGRSHSSLPEASDSGAWSFLLEPTEPAQPALDTAHQAVAKARSFCNTEGWAIDVLPRGRPHVSANGLDADSVAQLASAIDASVQRLELLAGGDAVGLVLTPTQLVRVESAILGTTGGLRFRAQFGRFATAVTSAMARPRQAPVES